MILPEELSRIDDLLVHGSLTEARAGIHRLCQLKLPRESLASVANLARRAFLPDKALRALHGIIRPPADTRKTQKATDREKAEYAGALIYVGAIEEALKLLDEVDRARHPIADLFEAFARARTWDYEGALKPLKRHGANPKVNAVGRLRGRFELAAALLDGPREFERCEALLERLLRETSPERFRIIYKDSLLLMSQCLIQRRKWADAASALDRLAELSAADGDSVFGLLTDKWRNIAALSRRPEDAEALRRLRSTRDALAGTRRYEDARSCDYYQALLRGDDKLLARLYFGTPYRAFKERVRKDLSDPGLLEGTHDWFLQRGGAARRALLDLSGPVGQLAKRAPLKEGDLPYRLLRALSLDFYRPLHGAELHALLYPGEYFNPDSSPDKLHQALRRLRAWIRQAGLPLEVAEHSSFYQLTATAPMALRVREVEGQLLREPTASRNRLRIYAAALEREFEYTAFSAQAAAEALGISSRSALRYLAKLRDRFEPQGSGPGARYRLKSG